MYYFAYIGMAIIIIHFILYYFNIDVFNYPTKPESKTHFIDNEITDSINELKKLNEYIDNETGLKCEATRCKAIGCDATKRDATRNNGPDEIAIC